MGLEPSKHKLAESGSTSSLSLIAYRAGIVAAIEQDETLFPDLVPHLDSSLMMRFLRSATVVIKVSSLLPTVLRALV